MDIISGINATFDPIIRTTKNRRITFMDAIPMGTFQLPLGTINQNVEQIYNAESIMISNAKLLRSPGEIGTVSDDQTDVSNAGQALSQTKLKNHRHLVNYTISARTLQAINNTTQFLNYDDMLGIETEEQVIGMLGNSSTRLLRILIETLYLEMQTATYIGSDGSNGNELYGLYYYNTLANLHANDPYANKPIKELGTVGTPLDATSYEKLNAVISKARADFMNTGGGGGCFIPNKLIVPADPILVNMFKQTNLISPTGNTISFPVQPLEDIVKNSYGIEVIYSTELEKEAVKQSGKYKMYMFDSDPMNLNNYISALPQISPVAINEFSRNNTVFFDSKTLKYSIPVIYSNLGLSIHQPLSAREIHIKLT